MGITDNVCKTHAQGVQDMGAGQGHKTWAQRVQVMSRRSTRHGHKVCKTWVQGVQDMAARGTTHGHEGWDVRWYGRCKTWAQGGLRHGCEGCKTWS